MEYLYEYNAIMDPRDYLLFFSMLVLLTVIYVLIRGYKATQNFEKKIEHFSTLTNDAFANQLNRVENIPHQYDIKSGSFGPLSKILDAYAVSTTDANGIITYANEKFCSASGYIKEELIGQPHSILTANFHEPEFWDDMWEKIKADKVWHGEIANNTKKNEVFWMDTFIFPLSLITDNSDGFISLRTDITKIKQQNSTLIEVVEKTGKKLHQVESMLLNSEKMSSLGTISAGIAHEINNPVAFVSSNITKIKEYTETLSIVIELLKGSLMKSDFDRLLTRIPDRTIDSDEVSYILEDCPVLIEETEDGIHRIKNIVTDLKSFSHQGSDELVLTNIHSCINTALNLARNELKYKVDIITNFSDNLPQVPCVESKIAQVLLNLFVNAAHAIKESGIIIVTTYVEDDNVAISVKDNGCGMEKEVQDNIFEPFYTTKPVGQGTGLGLSLSHDIISLHSGKILVNSQKGVGTEFIIRLPLGKPTLLPNKGKEKDVDSSKDKQKQACDKWVI